MENRNGLIVDALLTQADGRAERDAALLMMYRKWLADRATGKTKRRTLGADKAYDTRELVATLRELNVQPHVSQNSNRPGGSSLDRRTTRHAGYQISQKKRPLIEKAFAWMKQTGGLRKTKLRGLAKVGGQFLLTAAAFNLWRTLKLNCAPATA